MILYALQKGKCVMIANLVGYFLTFLLIAFTVLLLWGIIRAIKRTPPYPPLPVPPQDEQFYMEFEVWDDPWDR